MCNGKQRFIMISLIYTFMLRSTIDNSAAIAVYRLP